MCGTGEPRPSLARKLGPNLNAGSGSPLPCVPQDALECIQIASTAPSTAPKLMLMRCTICSFGSGDPKKKKTRQGMARHLKNAPCAVSTSQPASSSDASLPSRLQTCPYISHNAKRSPFLRTARASQLCKHLCGILESCAEMLLRDAAKIERRRAMQRLAEGQPKVCMVMNEFQMQMRRTSRWRGGLMCRTRYAKSTR